MPQKPSKNTDWAKGFLAAIKRASAVVDEIPEGFLSVVEYAQLWDCDTSTAYQLLNKGVETGLAERKRFRVMTSTGARSMAHYRQIKSAAAH